MMKKTKKSMQQIAQKAESAAESVQQIAGASEQQAKSIEQINVGINQISGVIQANSATAEESAASSEELSAQAITLQTLIAKFKLRDSTTTESAKTVGDEKYFNRFFRLLNCFRIKIFNTADEWAF